MKRKTLIFIVILLALLLTGGLGYRNLNSQINEYFEPDTNRFIEISDGRTYVLRKLGPVRRLVAALCFQGEVLPETETGSAARANLLRGKETTELLLLKENGTAYLGRLQSIQTWIYKQGISDEPHINDALSLFWGCSEPADLESVVIRQINEKGAPDKVLKTVNDTAALTSLWELLSNVSTYTGDLVKPTERAEYMLCIRFKNGAFLQIPRVYPYEELICSEMHLPQNIHLPGLAKWLKDCGIT